MSTLQQHRMNSEPVSGTLPTLKEGLDQVSLDDIDITSAKPLKKINKSPSQVFANNFNASTSPNNVKGLGINLPRRPSDSMFKTLSKCNNSNGSSSKISVLERPVSNDSITSSSVSEYSEGMNSRNSSITSVSMANSPIMQQHNNGSNISFHESKYQLHHSSIPSSANSSRFAQNESQISVNKLRGESVSTPKLNKFPSYSSFGSIPSTPMSSTSTNMSNSTVNTLTPSQKYRLRRQNSKSSAKANFRQREKYFDEINSDEEIIEDGLIWNVPFTKGSATIFSPTSGKSSKMLKNVITQSPAQMPLSPLPGTLSAPSTPTASRGSPPKGGYFYKNPDEAASLSRFYQASSDNFVAQELSNRESNGINLPSSIKEASELGLEDMKFISKEKADSFSATRPIWLPPKSKDESKKHERDISKMIEKAAKVDKKKQEYMSTMKSIQEKNIQRWIELQDRGVLRNSSQYEMKKLCFKTSIPENLRSNIWLTILQERSKDSDYEKFEELNSKLSSIPSFPKSKEYEIEKIVETILPNLSKFQKNQELNKSLTKLIKLKSISTRGLEYGDELLFAISLLNFNEQVSYDVTNMIKFSVLNEHTLNKFNNNLSKNAVLKKYLKNKDYKDDYEFLNSNLVFDILQNFQIETVYHLLDIIIIISDYKILYSIFLTILRDHHFGFVSLKELATDNSGHEIIINDEYQFFERLHHFYKKF